MSDSDQIQTLSVLVSRLALASKLGTAYGGDRDLYQALGYPASLNYDDFYDRYRRQDIVRAVVDKPVKATWRKGFSVVETKQGGETLFEKEWDILASKLQVVNKFSRADKLCAFGPYAILLLGFSDTVGVDDFKKPVGPGKNMLNFIRPFGCNKAEVHSLENDTKNDRYGLPLLYAIASSAPDEAMSPKILVHHTRVIHIAEDLLDSEVEGLCRLESIYNRFMDLEKLVGGSAEMFWRGARPGYHGKVDPDFTMTNETKEDLKNQLDEFEHNLRRVFINQGVDMQSLQQQIADPAAHVDIQLQMISAVTEIPKRVFVGSERGELASTQDRAAWVSVLSARREDFCEPTIIRPFIERCILYKVLSPPAEKYSIDWPEMFGVSEEDKARVGAIRATALKDYVSSPAAEAVVPPKAFFEFFLGFEKDDIELMEAMVEDAINEDDQSMTETDGGSAVGGGAPDVDI